MGNHCICLSKRQRNHTTNNPPEKCGDILPTTHTNNNTRRKSFDKSLLVQSTHSIVLPSSIDHELLITGFMRESQLDLLSSSNAAPRVFIPNEIIALISEFYPLYQVYGIGNQSGEFGLGHSRTIGYFRKFHTLSAMVHTAADIYRFHHRYMIRTIDGGLCCVGSNQCCECGLGEASVRSQMLVCKLRPKQLGYNKVDIVSTGLYSHSTFIVTVNNDIWAFGDNYYSQLGIKYRNREHGYNVAQPEAIAFDFKSKVIQIACGSRHTIFVTAEGCIYGCGYNTCGQIGSRLSDNIYIPTLIQFVNDNEKIVSVDCGYNYTLCLGVFGNVFGFGENTKAQIDSNADESVYKPLKIKFFEDICCVKVCCGKRHSAVVDANGFVYCFGNNEYGQIGNGNETALSSPHKLKSMNIEHLTDVTVDDDVKDKKELLWLQKMKDDEGKYITAADVSCGDNHKLILTQNNLVYTFGLNGSSQCSCFCDANCINVPYWLQREEIGIIQNCFISRVIGGISTTLIITH